MGRTEPSAAASLEKVDEAALFLAKCRCDRRHGGATRGFFGLRGRDGRRERNVVGEQLQPVDKILSPGCGDVPLNDAGRKKYAEIQGTNFSPGTGKNSTTKWSGLHYFIKHNLPISDSESICAENNDANYFGEEQVPIPQTTTPDF